LALVGATARIEWAVIRRSKCSHERDCIIIQLSCFRPNKKPFVIWC